MPGSHYYVGDSLYGSPRELPANIRGVIFDMDDTLINSEKAWQSASKALWESVGGALDGHDFLGGTVQDIARAFCYEHPVWPDGSLAEEDDVCRILETMIRDNLRTQLEPMPGAVALLERLHGHIPLAIGSNSPSAIVKESVDGLGWNRYFAATLGADDVAHPKPHPDLYKEAARRLGARPSQCVIFDDSPVGVLAALSAGAFVVAVGPAAAGEGHAAVPSLLDPLVATWRPERTA